MDIFFYALRKFIYGIPLLFGVTLISFVLMVYFGPDKTYDLLSRNPTVEEIAEVRHQLGYDRPFVVRYVEYLKEVITFDYGHSDSSGEKVTSIMMKTFPVSLLVTLPGFVIGNILGIALALVAAYYRGGIVDRLIMAFAVVGMSISFLIVLIAFQYIFSSSFGLNWFPVSGWSTETFGEYLKYVTVPTMVQVFVALGYNTRFYRSVMVEEIGREHVRTSKAYGCNPVKLLFVRVLKNAMIPIITRIIFSMPFILIGGSLLVESFFSIPGFGYTAFDAIVTGDLPIVKALVTSVAIVYVFVLIIVDILYQMVDPRISLK